MISHPSGWWAKTRSYEEAINTRGVAHGVYKERSYAAIIAQNLWSSHQANDGLELCMICDRKMLIRPCFSAVSAVETSRCELGEWGGDSPLPNKRVIRPDPDLVSSLLNFSDDDESADDEADVVDNEDKNPDARKNSWHKQCK